MNNLRFTFYALLVAFLMFGCNPEGSENDKNPEKKYSIVEIDGCEYIYISRRPWGSEIAITHKGDCKSH